MAPRYRMFAGANATSLGRGCPEIFVIENWGVCAPVTNRSGMMTG